MIFKLDITYKDGAKTYEVDTDDLPLILLESLDEGKVSLMRAGIAEFLGLSEAESRQLTVRHIKEIGKAMKAAQDIPNG